jgi:hypothetical protein
MSEVLQCTFERKPWIFSCDQRGGSHETLSPCVLSTKHGTPPRVRCTVKPSACTIFSRRAERYCLYKAESSNTEEIVVKRTLADTNFAKRKYSIQNDRDQSSDEMRLQQFLERHNARETRVRTKMFLHQALGELVDDHFGRDTCRRFVGRRDLGDDVVRVRDALGIVAFERGRGFGQRRVRGRIVRVYASRQCCTNIRIVYITYTVFELNQ